MQRGNLVIYDLDGKVWAQTGEAQGDIMPHAYPNGLPYIELPFGAMANKKLIGVDVSIEPHTPIFEDLPVQPTYQELQDMIEMMAEGVV